MFQQGIGFTLGDEGVGTVLAVKITAYGTNGQAPAAGIGMVKGERFDVADGVGGPLIRKAFLNFPVLFMIHLTNTVLRAAQFAAPFAVITTRISPFHVGRYIRFQVYPFGLLTIEIQVIQARSM